MTRQTRTTVTLKRINGEWYVVRVGRDYRRAYRLYSETGKSELTRWSLLNPELYLGDENVSLWENTLFFAGEEARELTREYGSVHHYLAQHGEIHRSELIGELSMERARAMGRYNRSFLSVTPEETGGVARVSRVWPDTEQIYRPTSRSGRRLLNLWARRSHRGVAEAVHQAA